MLSRRVQWLLKPTDSKLKGDLKIWAQKILVLDFNPFADDFLTWKSYWRQRGKNGKEEEGDQKQARREEKGGDYQQLREAEPWDSKEIKPVNPKGSQPWIFIGSTNAEAPILWPLMWRANSLEKILMLGKAGEGDDRGRDGLMASPTQFTWIWASSGGWW